MNWDNCTWGWLCPEGPIWYEYVMLYLSHYIQDKIKYLQNPTNLCDIATFSRATAGQNGTKMIAVMTQWWTPTVYGWHRRRWFISMFARTLYVAQTPSLLANFEPWKLQGSQKKITTAVSRKIAWNPTGNLFCMFFLEEIRVLMVPGALPLIASKTV